MTFIFNKIFTYSIEIKIISAYREKINIQYFSLNRITCIVRPEGQEKLKSIRKKKQNKLHLQKKVNLLLNENKTYPRWFVAWLGYVCGRVNSHPEYKKIKIKTLISNRKLNSIGLEVYFSGSI